MLEQEHIVLYLYVAVSVYVVYVRQSTRIQDGFNVLFFPFEYYGN